MEESMLRKLIPNIVGPCCEEDDLKDLKKADLGDEYWADYTIWLLSYFTSDPKGLNQGNRNGGTSKESKIHGFLYRISCT
jgi:hypothetical protein